MPRMRGTEVCARIRRDRRHRDLPILLATAAMVDLSALADADGFLVKPYQRDVLLSFVSHLVGKRASRTPGAARPKRAAERPATEKPAAGAARPAFRRGARKGPLGSTDRPSPARAIGAGRKADGSAGGFADEEE
jgi:DNA-binding response OmpR family regulator